MIDTLDRAIGASRKISEAHVTFRLKVLRSKTKKMPICRLGFGNG